MIPVWKLSKKKLSLSTCLSLPLATSLLTCPHSSTVQQWLLLVTSSTAHWLSHSQYWVCSRILRNTQTYAKQRTHNMQHALTLPPRQTHSDGATHTQYVPLISCGVHTLTHKHRLSTQCIIPVLRERTGGYWDSPHASSRSSCCFSASLPSLLVLFSHSLFFFWVFLSLFRSLTILTSLYWSVSLSLTVIFRHLTFCTNLFLAFCHLLYRCYLLDDWLHLLWLCAATTALLISIKGLQGGVPFPLMSTSSLYDFNMRKRPRWNNWHAEGYT